MTRSIILTVVKKSKEYFILYIFQSQIYNFYYQCMLDLTKDGMRNNVTLAQYVI